MSQPADARRKASGSPGQFEWIGLVVFGLALAGLAATWANLDFTGHRAALFMDEMIPSDNVKRILTAPSPGALGQPT
jgi:hypothetical protein